MIKLWANDAGLDAEHESNNKTSVFVNFKQNNINTDEDFKYMILTFLTKEPNPQPQSTNSNFLILKSFKPVVLGH